MAPPLRTVLVTGCSTGIGRATADRLASEGYRVIAGVRDRRQAEELSASENVTGIVLDVTCDAQVQAAVELVSQAAPDGLFALVNNAGLAAPSAVELVALDELRQMLEVNTIGVLRMIQAFLPLLRQGTGRIVNMSSMNGAIALPMVGAYSASKFAMEALSDTLRVELRPWGVPVSLIRPGQIRTAIFDKARAALAERSQQIPPHLEPGYRQLYEKSSRFNERGAKTGGTPEAVAATISKALASASPKPHYTVGWDACGLALLQSLLPQRIVDRMLARSVGTFKRLLS